LKQRELRVELMNESEILRAADANGAGLAATIDPIILPPGSYLLRVTGIKGFGGSQRYQITTIAALEVGGDIARGVVALSGVYPSFDSNIDAIVDAADVVAERNL